LRARIDAMKRVQERAPRLITRVGPFARDSERFVIRLLIGGIKKPR